MSSQGSPAAAARIFKLPGTFPLESGGWLRGVEIAYRIWGKLDGAGGNAVLICHGLTGSADADVWWKELFGPGRAFDVSRDFVICSNAPGSCYGTTGPASISPETGAPYGGDFPAITIRDIVRAQARLLDHLGVTRLRLVIGGSFGGMQALEWGALFPDAVEKICAIAVSGRHSAWCIGWSEAQRQAIFADPRWRGGHYPAQDGPEAGLAAARMVAMCTYRTRECFEERFSRGQRDDELFDVESYLRYQGKKLVNRFDAASYVTLTRAMDSHDLARGRGQYEEVLRSISVPALIVAIDSDILYPPEEQKELAKLLSRAKLAWISSPHGHDAFLIETGQVNRLVLNFLGRADKVPPATRNAEVCA